MRGLGYEEPTLLAVRQINLKQGLHTNPDVQAMEDALCLSFLEHELVEGRRFFHYDLVHGPLTVYAEASVMIMMREMIMARRRCSSSSGPSTKPSSSGAGSQSSLTST